MSKKIIIIFILSFLLLSCGFKRTNLDKSLIHLQNINVTGQNRISNIIKNNILLISDANAEKKYDIAIKVTKDRKIKIKDTTGKVTRYTLNINADLEIKNNTTQKIVKKVFNKNLDYNVTNSHTNTLTNEKSISKNLIQQLSDDLISFIIFSNDNYK